LEAGGRSGIANYLRQTEMRKGGGRFRRVEPTRMEEKRHEGVPLLVHSVPMTRETLGNFCTTLGAARQNGLF